MAYAILRGKNGRRHDVDFEDAPVRMQMYQSSEDFEIRMEADWETRPDGKRRYVHLNVPRERLLAAIAALARHRDLGLACGEGEARVGRGGVQAASVVAGAQGRFWRSSGRTMVIPDSSVSAGRDHSAGETA